MAREPKKQNHFAMIRVRTPYRTDKNLGKAYNDEFRLCPEQDWLCLIDHDVMFLTPDAIAIMEDYITRYPDIGLFTCFTNRIHPLSTWQLYLNAPSNHDSVSTWMAIAEEVKQGDRTITMINDIVSGFLMLISKKTWNEIPFSEDGLCLGVDNDFCRRLLANNKIIARMNKVLVWHTYRLGNITNKDHLKAKVN